MTCARTRVRAPGTVDHDPGNAYRDQAVRIERHASATVCSEEQPRAPVRVSLTVVVAQKVVRALLILGYLKRLVDGVEEIVSEVGHQVYELCDVRRNASNGLMGCATEP